LHRPKSKLSKQILADLEYTKKKWRPIWWQIRSNDLRAETQSELVNALNITTASMRHKIAILRASDPAFDDLYQEKSKRTELPVDLAEVIVRQLFDGNPHVRVEFVGAESN
jgi:hypothetical protein